MSSYPDANAFMRGYLRNPTDVTTRLVFADWLEETGELSNIAWARYIRLKAEADRCSGQSPEQGKLVAEAAELVPHIKARLTIPAALFVGYPRSLLQLLPAQNYTVKLATFGIPRAMIDLMPESVARENFVLPLDLQGRCLLVATTDPHNRDTIQKIQFILDKDVIAVCAEKNEIQEAIDHYYGQTEIECVESVLYESPLIGLEGDADSGVVFSLFFTAFSNNYSGFEIEQDEFESVVRYLSHQGLVRGEHYPQSVFTRLLSHLQSLPLETEYSDEELISRDIQIPLLSGRPFPATLQNQTTKQGNAWFRLRFRW